MEKVQNGLQIYFAERLRFDLFLKKITYMGDFIFLNKEIDASGCENYKEFILNKIESQKQNHKREKTINEKRN